MPDVEPNQGKPDRPGAPPRRWRGLAVGALFVVLAAGVLDGCGSGTGGTAAPTTAAPTTTAPASSPSTTISAGSALAGASTAEQDARAAYEAVIAKFGDVEPFSTVSEEESRHIATLASLAARHGVALPSGPITATTPPSTLEGACQLGVRTEEHLVAVYTELIPQVSAYPDLTQAFGNLQAAARDRHLPAFERCA